jgi:ribosome-binding protein aMBF1 (putative translation factor)
MQLSEMKKSLSDIESSQARSGKDLAQRVDEVKSGVKRLENYQAGKDTHLSLSLQGI